MMTDPIADMLTRIRNASMVHKKEVIVPFSKIKLAIANILVQTNYLEKAEEKKDGHPYLLLTLKYEGRTGVIQSIARISTPGHRKYVKAGAIGKVLNGFGIAILSTPKGLMTGADAIKNKVGGELICEVY